MARLPHDHRNKGRTNPLFAFGCPGSLKTRKSFVVDTIVLPRSFHLLHTCEKKEFYIRKFVYERLLYRKLKCKIIIKKYIVNFGAC